MTSENTGVATAPPKAQFKLKLGGHTYTREVDPDEVDGLKAEVQEAFKNLVRLFGSELSDEEAWFLYYDVYLIGGPPIRYGYGHGCR